MRRAISDTLLSAGALALLIFLLVLFDDRIREVAPLRGGQSASQVVDVTTQVRNTATLAYRSARDSSIEHAPLVLFALAGMVLLLIMMRT